MLIFSIIVWYFWRQPLILPNKTQKIVFIFFKTNPSVFVLIKNYFSMHFKLNSRKSKWLIWSQSKGMHILFIEISFLFLKTPFKKKKEQSYQVISQIATKNIPNKKLSKKTTKIHLKSSLTFLPRLTWIFKKTTKWQNSMVNRQRLTSWLTTTFS